MAVSSKTATLSRVLANLGREYKIAILNNRRETEVTINNKTYPKESLFNTLLRLIGLIENPEQKIKQEEVEGFKGVTTQRQIYSGTLVVAFFRSQDPDVIQSKKEMKEILNNLKKRIEKAENSKSKLKKTRLEMLTSRPKTGEEGTGEIDRQIAYLENKLSLATSVVEKMPTIEQTSSIPFYRPFIKTIMNDYSVIEGKLNKLKTRKRAIEIELTKLEKEEELIKESSDNISLLDITNTLIKALDLKYTCDECQFFDKTNNFCTSWSQATKTSGSCRFFENTFANTRWQLSNGSKSNSDNKLSTFNIE